MRVRVRVRVRVRARVGVRVRVVTELNGDLVLHSSRLGESPHESFTCNIYT